MQEPINFDLADILAAARIQSRSTNFIAAIGFTMPAEGVFFEVEPGDPGGATCCGIDQDDYDAWLTEKGLVTVSVQYITAAEVEEVAFDHYWGKLGCDWFQYAVALCLFDTAFNTGDREGIEILQHALGVTVDGVLGQGTLDAEHAYVVAHGAVALGTAIIAQRRAFYHKIPDPSGSLPGWLARCDALQAVIGAVAA